MSSGSKVKVNFVFEGSQFYMYALYIKSESTEFYCEQKCKSAAAIAKAQSGIAFKSITDPPSSFSSLKMTETC